ncbi:MAG: hypothetical protein RJB61_1314 [Actinomycetota bacterium]|jgi:hypothetical protein
MAQPRITRADLEARFSEVQSDLQGRLDDRRQSIVAVVSAVGIVVLVVAYLFGRRSGRRKTTFVEIRRS